jgi:hypothetical protein
MYATISRLDNKDGTRLAIIGNGGSAPVAPIPDGTSKGFQLGVRHFF